MMEEGEEPGATLEHLKTATSLSGDWDHRRGGPENNGVIF